MRVHTTKDGTKIKLCDMTDSHLAATIRLMERKAREGIVVIDGGGSGPDDFWYDEDLLHGNDALEHMGYYDYVAERDRRISNATGEPRGLPRSAPPDCSACAHFEQAKPYRWGLCKHPLPWWVESNSPTVHPNENNAKDCECYTPNVKDQARL